MYTKGVVSRLEAAQWTMLRPQNQDVDRGLSDKVTTNPLAAILVVESSWEAEECTFFFFFLEFLTGDDIFSTDQNI